MFGVKVFLRTWEERFSTHFLLLKRYTTANNPAIIVNIVSNPDGVGVGLTAGEGLGAGVTIGEGEGKGRTGIVHQTCP